MGDAPICLKPWGLSVSDSIEGLILPFPMQTYWPHTVPFAAGLTVLWALGGPLQWWGIGWSTLALVGAVLASVHHAEVIAHKVGEPYGTLVLALAVTIIEVALIVSLMLADGASAPASTGESPTASLPRDTIYAAIMIICNGVVGLCVLIGGLHHREQTFRIEGTGSGFAALATLSVLVLVMPTLTTSSADNRPAQTSHNHRGFQSSRAIASGASRWRNPSRARLSIAQAASSTPESACTPG